MFHRKVEKEKIQIRSRSSKAPAASLFLGNSPSGCITSRGTAAPNKAKYLRWAQWGMRKYADNLRWCRNLNGEILSEISLAFYKWFFELLHVSPISPHVSSLQVAGFVHLLHRASIAPRHPVLLGSQGCAPRHSPYNPTSKGAITNWQNALQLQQNRFLNFNSWQWFEKLPQLKQSGDSLQSFTFTSHSYNASRSCVHIITTATHVQEDMSKILLSCGRALLYDFRCRWDGHVKAITATCPDNGRVSSRRTQAPLITRRPLQRKPCLGCTVMTTTSPVTTTAVSDLSELFAVKSWYRWGTRKSPP